MAILGLGVDLIEVARFAREEARRGPDLLATVLSAAEIDRCRRARRPHAAQAAHFAAKEAFLKALGSGPLSWHDLEVEAGGAGPPTLRLRGEAARLAAARGVAQVALGLAVTAGHAAAMVALSGPQGASPLPEGVTP